MPLNDNHRLRRWMCFCVCGSGACYNKAANFERIRHHALLCSYRSGSAWLGQKSHPAWPHLFQGSAPVSMGIFHNIVIEPLQFRSVHKPWDGIRFLPLFWMNRIYACRWLSFYLKVWFFVVGFLAILWAEKRKKGTEGSVIPSRKFIPEWGIL